MADTKISALTPVESLAGDELIPAVKGTGNVSLTPAQIAALAMPVSVAVYAADKTALDLITDQAAATGVDRVCRLQTQRSTSQRRCCSF